MKAVFTQAVVGALDDIVQHTGRAGGGGGAQRGGRAVAEVKKTASTEHAASTFPSSSLSLCVHGSVEECVYLENIIIIIFFYFPAQSFTRALRQICYSTPKVFSFIYLFIFYF